MTTSEQVWKILEDRWDKGFDGLLIEEKQAIALWWLQAETMNGGLDQFFWNSSGDLALLARAALHGLEQRATLAALDSALQHFGASYPVEREERMQALKKIEQEHGVEVFTPASDVIQDLPEDFVEAAIIRLLEVYARNGIYLKKES